MALTTKTQVHTEVKVRAPLHQYLKWKLKIFLKRTIGHTRLYRTMRVAYHYYTGSARYNAAKLLREEFLAQEARKQQEQQQLAEQYTPPQAMIEVHPIRLPLYGGAPVKVETNGQFSACYRQIQAQQVLSSITTLPTSLRPARTFQTCKLVPPERGSTHGDSV